MLSVYKEVFLKTHKSALQGKTTDINRKVGVCFSSAPGGRTF